MPKEDIDWTAITNFFEGVLSEADAHGLTVTIASEALGDKMTVQIPPFATKHFMEHLPTYRAVVEPINDDVNESLVQDVFFETMRHAESILAQLRDLIDKNSRVSISQYYHLLEIKTKMATHEYGWENLDTAEIVKYGFGYGYVIKFPPLEKFTF